MLQPQDPLHDVKFHFTQVFLADIVARATGYRGGGGADLADFLEALGAAYDATRRVSGLDADWLDGVIVDKLACRVAEQLQAGHSIVDLPDILGESFMRIVASTSNAKPTMTWTWSEERWIEFESEVLSKENHSTTYLEREFGVSRPQAAHLLSLYGRETSGNEMAERRERLWQIFRDNPMTTTRQLHTLACEQGMQWTLAAVRKNYEKYNRQMVA